MTLPISALPASPEHPAIVLVVAIGDSVHTHRWLRAACSEGLRLILMPVAPRALMESESFVPVSDAAGAARLRADEIGLWAPAHYERLYPSDDLPPPLEFVDRAPFQPGASVVRAMARLRPQLIHSMELQMAGYACLSAARRMGEDFPPWMVSNWGSDLFLYGKLADHRPVLGELMARASAYLSECARDVAMAKQMGFRGLMLPPLPASGGMNQSALPETSLPSQRSEILVKGYHGWAGRGLHILSAMHLAAPVLRRFRIRVRHASPAVAAMVDTLREEDGLDIAVEPHLSSHEESLARLAAARLSVSLGVSGGIDTTMLESMSLGAFPITTCASCAGEWIESGRDGFTVNPHDVAALARALTVAATDDGLVDRAALRNRAEAVRRWDATTNGRTIQAHYRAALAAAANMESVER